MKEEKTKEAIEKIKEIKKITPSTPGPEWQKKLIVAACDKLLTHDHFGLWVVCDTAGELLQAAVSMEQGMSFEEAVKEAKNHPAKI